MPIPFNEPPKKPEGGWWKSIPGQAAIVVIGFGVLMIICALLGIIGPYGPAPTP